MIWVYGIIVMVASWWIGHIIGCMIAWRHTLRHYGEERLAQVKKEIPWWKPWKAFPWLWEKKGDDS